MPLGTFDRCGTCIYATHGQKEMTLVLTSFLLTHLEITVNLNATQELKQLIGLMHQIFRHQF